MKWSVQLDKLSILEDIIIAHKLIILTKDIQSDQKKQIHKVNEIILKSYRVDYNQLIHKDNIFKI